MPCDPDRDMESVLTGSVLSAGFMISRGWISFFLDDQISDDHCFNAYNGIRCGFRRTVQTRRAMGLSEVLVTIFLESLYKAYCGRDTIHRGQGFRGGRITLSNAGNVCGPLLMRSLSRSEKIHNALLCRGFDGTLWRGKCCMNRLSMQDIVFGLFWTAYFLIVRFFDISRIIGDLTVRCVI